MDRRELRKKLLKRSREQIEENLSGKEIHIIKAVKLLSDLDDIINLLKENIEDWKKRNPTEKAGELLKTLETNNNSIETERDTLNQFIEFEMKKEFPNFSVLATPILGAKLLASSGSKQKLCFSTASTIQVLGAEKALFNHLKKKGTCPKHGHLFNHPLVQRLPTQKRGKAARVIAGKLSIALKKDYFNGENNSQKELNNLEERIAQISREPLKIKKEKTKERTNFRQKERPKNNFSNRKRRF
jgi:nucleolar protein 56